MIHYKLLVVHWSIFTLSVQLIYCASLHSIRDSVMTSTGGVGSSITVSPSYKSSQTVSHQSICNAETEHVLSVNGKESSIILDLEPNRIQMGPCKRTFRAPEPDNSGFIVKLLKFKSKQMRNPNSHIDSNAGGVSIDMYNETATCPLNIMMGEDTFMDPWKLDPCKMETHGVNEVVRLTEGLLRISWTPNRHSPKYKLIITPLGKGYHCNQGKHPCLKLGKETLFCVSSNLICDGINHCPLGEEYNSDEDPTMCARQRGLSHSNTSFGITIWQQISKEFFNKLYPTDATTTTPQPKLNSKVTTKKTSAKDANDEDFDYNDRVNSNDDEMESSTKQHRHMTISRGLSKYGPWGYLILGMLLCGGALLVCVLWECCCKRNKTPLLNTDSSNISTITGNGTNSNFNSAPAESALPPNYDEIDPPPSYATLFPNNKIFTTESSSTMIPNPSNSNGADCVVQSDILTSHSDTQPPPSSSSAT